MMKHLRWWFVGRHYKQGWNAAAEKQARMLQAIAQAAYTQGWNDAITEANHNLSLAYRNSRN